MTPAPTPAEQAPAVVERAPAAGWRLTPNGGFMLVIAAMAVFFLVRSFEWPAGTALMPRLVSGAALLVVVLYGVDALRKGPGAAQGRIMDVGRLETGDLTRRQVRLRMAEIAATLVALVGAVWAVGFHLAIPIYVFLSLWRLGHTRWWTALLTAAAFEALLVGLYDNVIHITWHTTLLDQLLRGQP